MFCSWLRPGSHTTYDEAKSSCDALNRGLFPLFVSEGTSDEKCERIRHNDYLAKAYRSFSEIQGALFIFGHSLADNDAHYLRRIQRGKISHVYVGLYGSPDTDANKQVMRRSKELSAGRSAKRPLSVSFFDAASASVWGHKPLTEGARELSLRAVDYW